MRHDSHGSEHSTAEDITSLVEKKNKKFKSIKYNRNKSKDGRCILYTDASIHPSTDSKSQDVGTQSPWRSDLIETKSLLHISGEALKVITRFFNF